MLALDGLIRGGVVERRPRGGLTGELGGQHGGGGRPVAQPPLLEAGGDPGPPAPCRSTDVGDLVDRHVVVGGPAGLDGADVEVAAGPLLDLVVVVFGGSPLAHLVAPAPEQDALGAVGEGDRPDGARRRVGGQVHPLRHRPADASGQGVGPHRVALGEVAAGIDEGQQGGDHGVGGGDGATLGVHHHPLALLGDTGDPGALEDGDPGVAQRPTEAEAVVAWVDGELALEAHGAEDGVGELGLVGERGGEAEAGGELGLLLDTGELGRVGGVGVGGPVLGPAVDPEAVDEASHHLDGRLVGLAVDPCPVLAHGGQQLGVGEAVEGGDLGGGEAGGAGGQLPSLQQRHPDAGVVEGHGGGEPGDAPADHADVDVEVPLQCREGGADRGGGGPDGGMGTVLGRSDPTREGVGGHCPALPALTGVEPSGWSPQTRRSQPSGLSRAVSAERSQPSAGVPS